MANNTVPQEIVDQSGRNLYMDERQEFEQTKAGVKGLVDRGITTIPRFFVFPESNKNRLESPFTKASIPIIDFSSPRSTLVNSIKRACSTLGFFHIINHGLPDPKRILNSVKEFHELPQSTKSQYYRRDLVDGVAYMTNSQLYNSSGANWRDTLKIRLNPEAVEWDHVPEVCRDAAAEWGHEIEKFGEVVMGLLCEGLGVETRRLKKMTCSNARTLVGKYYPHCPQPELAIGLEPHTDPGVITLLVHNGMPGLQIKCGEEWLDVELVDGAIGVNTGDLLQIISNDEYKSVEHRVLVNDSNNPRVSAVCFFNPIREEDLCGPLPELVSAAKPAVYRNFMQSDYMETFYSRCSNDYNVKKYYKL